MADLYEDLKTCTVIPLLGRFGNTDCIVQSRTVTAYDIVADAEVSVTTDHPARAVFGQFGNEETLNGVVPQSNDESVIFLTDDGYVPSSGDLIIAGASTYRIEAVRSVNPNGKTDLLFKAIARPHYA